jgi:undecaprenyl phosphate-alpha-L-ara4FN deformylase
VPDVRIGLRVDVDTFRGTRLGARALSRLLIERGIRATFFFSVGPDNMGRHVWRLARPSFLWKMMRSNAPGLYGWNILLRGTLWPGPRIGERLSDAIRAVRDDGHEIGFHAWDHHAWQTHVESWSRERIRSEMGRGVNALTAILGTSPTCAAAPGWRADDRVLDVEREFGFTFNSDCRGHSIFVPAAAEGEGPAQPQVPVTLPTYDEVVGRSGVTPGGYYGQLSRLARPRDLNVLAIHAEVEGMGLRTEFERYVDRAARNGWTFVRLGTLAAEAGEAPRGTIERTEICGRQGWVARQSAP